MSSDRPEDNPIDVMLLLIALLLAVLILRSDEPPAPERARYSWEASR